MRKTCPQVEICSHAKMGLLVCVIEELRYFSELSKTKVFVSNASAPFFKLFVYKRYNGFVKLVVEKTSWNWSAAKMLPLWYTCTDSEYSNISRAPFQSVLASIHHFSSRLGIISVGHSILDIFVWPSGFPDQFHPWFQNKYLPMQTPTRIWNKCTEKSCIFMRDRQVETDTDI